ncbi:hypothetical protein CBR_g33928 [Chara braunii]|uniref:PHD-type domain-containing protein n=1 Tax=Chara braunii TaxID=69332 RepID=A0A388LHD2_CHABU|nr:hypothetical protein CBR_g33928 [Chara braunii]|eukprot:GBG81750.1 hypothetical protein CBR_g33928 [Chara braunii]
MTVSCCEWKAASPSPCPFLTPAASASASSVVRMETDQGEGLVGRRVRKVFDDHGAYCGTVVAYDRKYGYFRVRYDDGDEEDLDSAELESIICKKRGRPRKSDARSSVGEEETKSGSAGTGVMGKLMSMASPRAKRGRERKRVDGLKGGLPRGGCEIGEIVGTSDSDSEEGKHRRRPRVSGSDGRQRGSRAAADSIGGQGGDGRDGAGKAADTNGRCTMLTKASLSRATKVGMEMTGRKREEGEGKEKGRDEKQKGGDGAKQTGGERLKEKELTIDTKAIVEGERKAMKDTEGKVEGRKKETEGKVEGRKKETEVKREGMQTKETVGGEEGEEKGTKDAQEVSDGGPKGKRDGGEIKNSMEEKKGEGAAEVQRIVPRGRGADAQGERTVERRRSRRLELVAYNGQKGDPVRGVEKRGGKEKSKSSQRAYGPKRLNGEILTPSAAGRGGQSAAGSTICMPIIILPDSPSPERKITKGGGSSDGRDRREGGLGIRSVRWAMNVSASPASQKNRGDNGATPRREVEIVILPDSPLKENTMSTSGGDVTAEGRKETKPSAEACGAGTVNVCASSPEGDVGCDSKRAQEALRRDDCSLTARVADEEGGEGEEATIAVSDMRVDGETTSDEERRVGGIPLPTTAAAGLVCDDGIRSCISGGREERIDEGSCVEKCAEVPALSALPERSCTKEQGEYSAERTGGGDGGCNERNLEPVASKAASTVLSSGNENEPSLREAAEGLCVQGEGRGEWRQPPSDSEGPGRGEEAPSTGKEMSEPGLRSSTAVTEAAGQVGTAPADDTKGSPSHYGDDVAMATRSSARRSGEEARNEREERCRQDVASGAGIAKGKKVGTGVGFEGRDGEGAAKGFLSTPPQVIARLTPQETGSPSVPEKHAEGGAAPVNAAKPLTVIRTRRDAEMASAKAGSGGAGENGEGGRDECGLITSRELRGSSSGRRKELKHRTGPSGIKRRRGCNGEKKAESSTSQLVICLAATSWQQGVNVKTAENAGLLEAMGSPSSSANPVSPPASSAKEGTRISRLVAASAEAVADGGKRALGGGGGTGGGESEGESDQDQVRRAMENDCASCSLPLVGREEQERLLGAGAQEVMVVVRGKGELLTVFGEEEERAAQQQLNARRVGRLAKGDNRAELVERSAPSTPAEGSAQQRQPVKSEGMVDKGESGEGGDERAAVVATQCASLAGMRETRAQAKEREKAREVGKVLSPPRSSSSKRVRAPVELAEAVRQARGAGEGGGEEAVEPAAKRSRVSFRTDGMLSSDDAVSLRPHRATSGRREEVRAKLKNKLGKGGGNDGQKGSQEQEKAGVDDGDEDGEEEDDDDEDYDVCAERRGPSRGEDAKEGRLRRRVISSTPTRGEGESEGEDGVPREAPDARGGNDEPPPRLLLPPLPPCKPLPQSSLDLPVPANCVSELMGVYAMLRTFSLRLFLSPFTFETFCGALTCKKVNSLVDGIHLALLKVLHQRFLQAAEDVRGKKWPCVRQMKWSLLDEVTWPEYLLFYLVARNFGKERGLDLVRSGLLKSEYYVLPLEVKLAMLSFLCDDALETCDVRAEILVRESNELEGGKPMPICRRAEIDLIRPSTPVPKADTLQLTAEKQKKRRGRPPKVKVEVSEISEPPAVQRVEELDVVKAVEGDDGNADECVLCGMDGNLLCCDGCPAAFHTRCVVGMAKMTIPSGPWFCPECVIARREVAGADRLAGLRLEALGADLWGRMFWFSCGRVLVVEDSATGTVPHYYSPPDMPKLLAYLDECPGGCQGLREAVAKCIEACQPWMEARRREWEMETTKVQVDKNEKENESAAVVKTEEATTDPVDPCELACGKDVAKVEGVGRVSPKPESVPAVKGEQDTVSDGEGKCSNVLSSQSVDAGLAVGNGGDLLGRGKHAEDPQGMAHESGILLDKALTNVFCEDKVDSEELMGRDKKQSLEGRGDDKLIEKDPKLEAGTLSMDIIGKEVPVSGCKLECAGGAPASLAFVNEQQRRNGLDGGEVVFPFIEAGSMDGLGKPVPECDVAAEEVKSVVHSDDWQRREVEPSASLRESEHGSLGQDIKPASVSNACVDELDQREPKRRRLACGGVAEEGAADVRPSTDESASICDVLPANPPEAFKDGSSTDKRNGIESGACDNAGISASGPRRNSLEEARVVVSVEICSREIGSAGLDCGTSMLEERRAVVEGTTRERDIDQQRLSVEQKSLENDKMGAASSAVVSSVGVELKDCCNRVKLADDLREQGSNLTLSADDNQKMAEEIARREVEETAGGDEHGTVARTANRCGPLSVDDKEKMMVGNGRRDVEETARRDEEETGRNVIECGPCVPLPLGTNLCDAKTLDGMVDGTAGQGCLASNNATATEALEAEHLNRIGGKWNEMFTHVNRYALAELSATAAAKLMSVPNSGGAPADSAAKKKRRRADLTEQMRVFSETLEKFHWPQKSKITTPDKCGWCSMCKNGSLKKGCLMNAVAVGVASGMMTVPGKAKLLKNVDFVTHLPSVAAYVLHLEENLHGLAVGKWEELGWRKKWHQMVVQATKAFHLKKPLLELESSLRKIAVLSTWVTDPEDLEPCPSLSLGGCQGGSLLTSGATKGNATVVRRRRNGNGRFAAAASAAEQLSAVQWWKGSRTFRRVMNLHRLPSSAAKAAARQGGWKPVKGLIYDDASELTIRTKQCAWRARVERVHSTGDLALLVREIDAHIRWESLKPLDPVGPSSAATAISGELASMLLLGNSQASLTAKISGKVSNAGGVAAANVAGTPGSSQGNAAGGTIIIKAKRTLPGGEVQYLICSGVAGAETQKPADKSIQKAHHHKEEALKDNGAVAMLHEGSGSWVKEMDAPLYLVKGFEEKLRRDRNKTANNSLDVAVLTNVAKKTSAHWICGICAKFCDGGAKLSAKCKSCKEVFHRDCMQVVSAWMERSGVQYLCKQCYGKSPSCGKEGQRIRKPSLKRMEMESWAAVQASSDDGKMDEKGELSQDLVGEEHLDFIKEVGKQTVVENGEAPMKVAKKKNKANAPNMEKSGADGIDESSIKPKRKKVRKVAVAGSATVVNGTDAAKSEPLSESGDPLKGGDTVGGGDPMKPAAVGTSKKRKKAKAIPSLENLDETTVAEESAGVIGEPEDALKTKNKKKKRKKVTSVTENCEQVVLGGFPMFSGEGGMIVAAENGVIPVPPKKVKRPVQGAFGKKKQTSANGVVVQEGEQIGGAAEGAKRPGGATTRQPPSVSAEEKKLLKKKLKESMSLGGRVCYVCCQPYDPERLYIGCDWCEAWYHGEIYQLTPEAAIQMTSFKCFRCRKKGRPVCPPKGDYMLPFPMEIRPGHDRDKRNGVVSNFSELPYPSDLLDASFPFASLPGMGYPMEGAALGDMVNGDVMLTEDMGSAFSGILDMPEDVLPVGLSVFPEQVANEVVKRAEGGGLTLQPATRTPLPVAAMRTPLPVVVKAGSSSQTAPNAIPPVIDGSDGVMTNGCGMLSAPVATAAGLSDHIIFPSLSGCAANPPDVDLSNLVDKLHQQRLNETGAQPICKREDAVEPSGQLAGFGPEADVPSLIAGSISAAPAADVSQIPEAASHGLSDWAWGSESAWGEHNAKLQSTQEVGEGPSTAPSRVCPMVVRGDDGLQLSLDDTLPRVKGELDEPDRLMHGWFSEVLGSGEGLPLPAGQENIGVTTTGGGSMVTLGMGLGMNMCAGNIAAGLEAGLDVAGGSMFRMDEQDFLNAPIAQESGDGGEATAHREAVFINQGNGVLTRLSLGGVVEGELQDMNCDTSSLPVGLSGKGSGGDHEPTSCAVNGETENGLQPFLGTWSRRQPRQPRRSRKAQQDENGKPISSSEEANGAERRLSDGGSQCSSWNGSNSKPAKTDGCCEICTLDRKPLLVCSLCSLTVHGQCYVWEDNLQPEDNHWECDTCRDGIPPGQGTCLLCPKMGGALKREINGGWAHAVCALWMPETFANAFGVIENIVNIRQERWKRVCVVCKEVYGACIPCAHKGCRVAFHPFCVRDAGLPLLIESRSDDLNYTAYCQRHAGTLLP